MKHIFIAIFLLVSFASYSQLDLSDHEEEMAGKFETLSDDLLWKNKESFMSKAHSRQISGTIALTLGVPTLAFGIVDGVINKNEASYSSAGAGILLSIVGIVLTNSSKNNKVKDLIIERELFRRSKAHVSMTGTGVRLSF